MAEVGGDLMSLMEAGAGIGSLCDTGSDHCSLVGAEVEIRSGLCSSVVLIDELGVVLLDVPVGDFQHDHLRDEPGLLTFFDHRGQLLDVAVCQLPVLLEQL